MKIHLGEAGEKDDKEQHLRLPRADWAWCRILVAWKRLQTGIQDTRPRIYHWLAVHLSYVTSLSGFSWLLSKAKS